MVDPIDMLVDERTSTAGHVMGLREVLAEHTPAEFGFVPGDFLTLCPRKRIWISVDKVVKIHRFCNILFTFAYASPSVVSRTNQPCAISSGRVAPRLWYVTGRLHPGTAGWHRDRCDPGCLGGVLAAVCTGAHYVPSVVEQGCYMRLDRCMPGLSQPPTSPNTDQADEHTQNGTPQQVYQCHQDWPIFQGCQIG